MPKREPRGDVAFGVELAGLARARGWTVKRAASLCEVTPRAWYNWVEGLTLPDLDRARRLSAALDLSRDEWHRLGGLLVCAYLGAQPVGDCDTGGADCGDCDGGRAGEVVEPRKRRRAGGGAC